MSDKKNTDKNWAVWRQDTHGNIFKMRDGLNAQEAEALAAEYEAKGHKQHYWIDTEC